MNDGDLLLILDILIV